MEKTGTGEETGTGSREVAEGGRRAKAQEGKEKGSKIEGGEEMKGMTGAAGPGTMVDTRSWSAAQMAEAGAPNGTRACDTQHIFKRGCWLPLHQAAALKRVPVTRSETHVNYKCRRRCCGVAAAAVASAAGRGAPSQKTR